MLNEEIVLADLEIHDTRFEDLDIEAALNFATGALTNAATFWTQCSGDQKQRFQRALFPDGLIFGGESYRTATTCLAFSYLRDVSASNSSLASQNVPTWNQIISWLKEMETLRSIATYGLKTCC